MAREDYENPRKLRFHANVRVALNEPHLLVPLNDPPNELHSVIPWGNALQVTGEEDHLSEIARYITKEGDGIALGTLSIADGGTPRAPKKVIEIRIDGKKIGTLTTTSSQHFIPTVRHLESRGFRSVAWLRVRGNAIAARVTVQAAKAHEISSDWFEESHSVPRLHGSSLHRHGA